MAAGWVLCHPSEKTTKNSQNFLRKGRQVFNSYTRLLTWPELGRVRQLSAWHRSLIQVSPPLGLAHKHTISAALFKTLPPNMFLFTYSIVNCYRDLPASCINLDPRLFACFFHNTALPKYCTYTHQRVILYLNKVWYPLDLILSYLYFFNNLYFSLPRYILLPVP